MFIVSERDRFRVTKTIAKCVAVACVLWQPAFARAVDKTGDPFAFVVFQNPGEGEFSRPRIKVPNLSRVGYLPTLTVCDGLVCLEVTKTKDPLRNRASGFIHWRSSYTALPREEKTGEICERDHNGLKQCQSDLRLQYELAGDDFRVYFSDVSGRGKGFKWIPAESPRYFLTATEGDRAGWYVDFGPQEEVRIGGADYVHWPATLVKKPGKMSEMNVGFERETPVAP